MARGGLRCWHLLVIVLLAAMIGTALGDLLAKALPGWQAAELLSAGVQVGTSAPLDLDLKVAQITFGLGLRLTVMGGLLAALALLLFVRRV